MARHILPIAELPVAIFAPGIHIAAVGQRQCMPVADADSDDRYLRQRTEAGNEAEMRMAAVSISSCAFTYPAQRLDSTRDSLLSFLNGLSEHKKTEEREENVNCEEGRHKSTMAAFFDADLVVGSSCTHRP